MRTFWLFYTIFLFAVACFDVLSAFSLIVQRFSGPRGSDVSRMPVLILILKIMLFSRVRHFTLAEFVLAFSWHFLKKSFIAVKNFFTFQLSVIRVDTLNFSMRTYWNRSTPNTVFPPPNLQAKVMENRFFLSALFICFSKLTSHF